MVIAAPLTHEELILVAQAALEIKKLHGNCTGHVRGSMHIGPCVINKAIQAGASDLELYQLTQIVDPDLFT